MKIEKIKQNAGITLIALVVTIIVLLILAGVSIATLTGENGLLSKSKESTELYIIANEKEQISLAYNACLIDNLGATKIIAWWQLENELMSNDNDVTVDKGLNYSKVKFNNTEHIYLVDKNGNIRMEGDSDEYAEEKEEINNGLTSQEISYTDSLQTLVNPDRGLYYPISLQISDSTNEFSADIEGHCKNAINNNQKILHLRINIGKLSGNSNQDGVDKEFTNEQLDSLNSIFETIRNYNLNAIVRFVYDFNGESNKEPKSFDTIEKHISQLSNTFETYKDVITCVETGFLGPWGEMHSSLYQEDKYYTKLINDLLNNTPECMSINVRKPYYYKLVFNNLKNSSKNKYRVGIFNDGYLGSGTDLGTFDNNITRQDFITWMTNQGKYTYYGGEVTKSGSENDEQWSDEDYAISEMEKTHTYYLNSSYNTSILDDKWKNQIYNNSESEYNGQTAYKYIVDHLGYRLVLRDSKISEEVNQGEVCGVNLKIENVGFGNIIRNQKVSVILRNGSKYYETELNIDATSLDSQIVSDINFYFYVPSNIDTGEWDVYLKIKSTENPNYVIQFANTDIWDDDLLANKIGKITIKNGVGTEDVSFKQAFIVGAPNGTENTISQKIQTVSVEFVYYDRSNSDARMKSDIKNVELGTTINFKDQSSLSAVGTSIPEGYILDCAQCFAITKSWDGYDSITIPSTTSENIYYINIFVKKVPVTFAFWYNGEQIGSTTKQLATGTTIDFTNESSLSSIELSIPTGHTFNYAQCKAMAGDWGHYDSLTIPTTNPESSYWVDVFVN